MFIGQESDWETQKKHLPKALVLAFEEMRQHNPRELKPQSMDLTSVEGAYFMVQGIKTKEVDRTRPEAHRVHIDIQYIVNGTERFGYAQRQADLAAVEDRLEKDDIAFYPTPRDEFFFDLREGQFVVFFPGELHRPQVAIGPEANVLKVVIKVPCAALG